MSSLHDEEPKFFALGAKSGEPFVYIVIKRGTQLHVFLNRCPHKNLPLGTREKKPAYSNGELTCIQHKAVFAVDNGGCVRGVCAGQALWRIDVRVEGDAVLVA